MQCKVIINYSAVYFPLTLTRLLGEIHEVEQSAGRDIITHYFTVHLARSSHVGVFVSTSAVNNVRERTESHSGYLLNRKS